MLHKISKYQNCRDKMDKKCSSLIEQIGTLEKELNNLPKSDDSELEGSVKDLKIRLDLDHKKRELKDWKKIKERVNEDTIIKKLHDDINFLKKYRGFGPSIKNKEVGNLCKFVTCVKFFSCFFVQFINFMGFIILTIIMSDYILDGSDIYECKYHQHICNLDMYTYIYMTIALIISISIRFFNFYQIKKSGITPLFAENDNLDKYLVYFSPNIYQILFETVMYSHITYTIYPNSLQLMMAIFFNLQLVLIVIFNYVTNWTFDMDRSVYFNHFTDNNNGNDINVLHLDDLLNYALDKITMLEKKYI